VECKIKQFAYPYVKTIPKQPLFLLAWHSKCWHNSKLDQKLIFELRYSDQSVKKYALRLT